MIRDMTPEDYTVSVILLKRCWEEMDFPMPFNPVKVLALLKRGVEKDDYTYCIVYVEKDIILGVGVISVKDSWYGDFKTAYEIAWHADPLLPVHKKAYIMFDLYVEMEKWAIAYPVDYINMAVSTRPELGSVKRFFERRGYKPVSFDMFKEVDNVV